MSANIYPNLPIGQKNAYFPIGNSRARVFLSDTLEVFDIDLVAGLPNDETIAALDWIASESLAIAPESPEDANIKLKGIAFGNAMDCNLSCTYCYALHSTPIF